LITDLNSIDILKYRIINLLLFCLYCIPLLIKTVKEIKTILEPFSEDPEMKNYDAFALMIVTHGKDEKVLGYNACREEDDPERDVKDHMKKSEIVNCVYEICKKMETDYKKPKIVIFDCCRIRVLLYFLENFSCICKLYFFKTILYAKRIH
jgi:hypothetical protein